MKVYISGAITGNPHYEQEFKQTEEKLREEGFLTINPTNLKTIIPDATYEEYMAICIQLLKLADAIYMIPGWRASKGANREYGYALGTDKAIFPWSARHQVAGPESVQRTNRSEEQRQPPEPEIVEDNRFKDFPKGLYEEYKELGIITSEDGIDFSKADMEQIKVLWDAGVT